MRKFESQLILPFVTDPKTQKRQKKVEKMRLKTGEMVYGAEAAIQAPDLESCSHTEVPAPLTQPLTPLQQDLGALVPGEDKTVSLKWETLMHLRCGCCVKSRGIGKHAYTDAPFTNLPFKMLAASLLIQAGEKLKDSDIKNSLIKECSHFTAQMLHPPVQSCQSDF